MSQQSLWEWGGGEPDGGRRPPSAEARRPRGTLSLSELPEPLRTCRPAARELHLRLEKKLGVVDLTLTDNRRRMLSSRRRRNRQEIRAHHMFLGCEDVVVQAIVGLTEGDADARERIRSYIRDNRDAISFAPASAELDTSGAHHDLGALLRLARGKLAVHGCADALEDIQITWGRDGRGSRSIRFGSFDFDQRLIRVHPALDAAWVPAFFVEFIVYHELVHAVCPPVDGQGSRRHVHTPEFRALESEFPRYEDALAWESAHIQRFFDR